jgi:hypothetical protein
MEVSILLFYFTTHIRSLDSLLFYFAFFDCTLLCFLLFCFRCTERGAAATTPMASGSSAPPANYFTGEASAASASTASGASNASSSGAEPPVQPVSHMGVQCDGCGQVRTNLLILSHLMNNTSCCVSTIDYLT